MTARGLAGRGAANAALGVVGFAFVVPMVWVIAAAFNGTAGLAVSWPQPWTFENFSAVLNVETTYRPMLNGLILCGGGTLLAMFAAVLAAYPLSRYRHRWNRPFLLTILFAFVLLLSNDQLPASVSIFTFFGQYGEIVYGQLAAYSLLYSLPAIVLYLFLARRLGGAFSFGGAMKG